MITKTSNLNEDHYENPTAYLLQVDKDLTKLYEDRTSGGGGKASKSFIITNPTSSADSPIWRSPSSITISSVSVLCMDGTNVVGQLWAYDTNGANGASVDASDITGTAGTNITSTTFSNPSIGTGDYVGWKTTSVSGAVTRVIVTFEYL